MLGNKGAVNKLFTFYFGVVMYEESEDNDEKVPIFYIVEEKCPSCESGTFRFGHHTLCPNCQRALDDERYGFVLCKVCFKSIGVVSRHVGEDKYFVRDFVCSECRNNL